MGIHESLLTWVFILHPGEILPLSAANLLYAQSRHAVIDNLASFVRAIYERDDSFEFVTISAANRIWRQHKATNIKDDSKS